MSRTHTRITAGQGPWPEWTIGDALLSGILLPAVRVRISSDLRHLAIAPMIVDRLDDCLVLAASQTMPALLVNGLQHELLALLGDVNACDCDCDPPPVFQVESRISSACLTV